MASALEKNLLFLLFPIPDRRVFETFRPIGTFTHCRHWSAIGHPPILLRGWHAKAGSAIHHVNGPQNYTHSTRFEQEQSSGSYHSTVLVDWSRRYRGRYQLNVLYQPVGRMLKGSA